MVSMDKVGSYLSQFGDALAPFAQQGLQRSQDKMMRQAFGINPAFASALYEAQNEQRKLQLQEEAIQEQQRQKSALAELAQKMGSVGANGPQQPMDSYNALLRYAQITGDMEPVFRGGAESPSNVREFQYWSSLSPEEKRAYLQVKRAQQVIDLGGEQVVLDPQGGVMEAYGKTLSPADVPSNAADKVSAQESARIFAEQQGDIDKKVTQAESITSLAQEAKEILPKATSGLMGQVVTGTSKAFGKSTDASKSDARLKVIAAALTSNVPRMEGPQGVLDVELYKQAAADVANSSLPYEDRLAAVDTVENLQKKYVAKNKKTNGIKKGKFTGNLVVQEMTDEDILRALGE